MIVHNRQRVSRLCFRILTFVAFVIIFAVTSASAHPAWGIVVTSTGIVYFSDLETVWKIDRDGKLTVFRAGVNGRHVHELWIDDHDNIYGPDYSYDAATQRFINGVWKMTPDGQQTYLQPPTDRAGTGVSIWRDRVGNMYSIEQNNHTKTRTLLLRRTPDGVVSTLAGGAYGHADGKGAAAKFSSVDAIVFGPDGNLYLTDAAYVRRVSMDGVVITLARDLSTRTSEDKPTLFGGTDAGLAGLSVDGNGNVYVADAGNRRLVKIANDGKVSIIYRLDPPYFPNGVFATPAGDIYVLEFSFTPPGTTGSPRVRKFTTDGKNILLATVSSEAGGTEQSSAPGASSGRTFGFVNKRFYIVLLLGAGLITVLVFVWRRSQKQQRT